MAKFLRWLKVAFYSGTFLTLLGAGAVETHRTIGTVGMLELLGVKVPVKREFQEVEVIKEIERARVNFDDALVARLKESRVSKWLVNCILARESSGSKRMSLTRFEQSYMQRAAQITRNADEQRLWASSWCPFQIMAPWAKKYDLDWSDLLDPETCVHVGMSILEQCWKDAKGKGREKVYNVGICYNGPTGQSYAQALVECVSSEAIDKILQGEG